MTLVLQNAHAVHPDDASIGTLARNGTGVVHRPTGNARLGSGINRLRDLRDAGVPVGLGGPGARASGRPGLAGSRQAGRPGRLAAGQCAARGHRRSGGRTGPGSPVPAGIAGGQRGPVGEGGALVGVDPEVMAADARAAGRALLARAAQNQ